METEKTSFFTLTISDPPSKQTNKKAQGPHKGAKKPRLAGTYSGTVVQTKKLRHKG